MNAREKLGLRLLSKIDMRDDHECWPWRGYIQKSGHGQIHLRGKTSHVHRAVWEWNNGPIPDGMYIRHACNNPACANPNHLAIGTHQDNMADWALSGDRKGVGNPMAKLTDERVRDIRARVAAGETRTSVAALHGLSGHDPVGQIVRRETWKHVS